jgi:hypothetical protein
VGRVAALINPELVAASNSMIKMDIQFKETELEFRNTSKESVWDGRRA